MKVKKMVTILTLLLLTITLTLACGGPNVVHTPTGTFPILTVMTHDSFSVREGLISDFERDNNVDVVFVKSGDTGSSLNRAILSKDAPIADVFYGVDNTFLSRALEEDIFEAYEPELLKEVLPEFKLDPQNRVVPVDFGDVCINYDKSYFAENDLALPQSLEELTQPEYEGLLVVENPAVSSPGLSFLLATIDVYGADGYLDYWQRLRDNGVVVVNDWETAYYTNFSGSSGNGPQPMAVSYSSSPAAEVIFATEELAEAPTGSLVAPGMCYRQVEFAGILKGTQNRAMAEKFVDFMLDWAFQEDLPTQMFVYPVNRTARMPQEFLDHAMMAEQPSQLDPQLVAENREDWIAAWDETVLK